MESTLSKKNVSLLKAGVAYPNYLDKDIDIGIVHIGPGAFHRAHQAVYVDDILNAGDLRWGICEVSVNSPGVRDALAPQDHLYTLAVLDHEIEYRVIGSIQKILVAPENPSAVIEEIARESVKIISLTVTEKGYCLGGDDLLDWGHPNIIHDLKNLSKPKSVIGFIVAGLKQRKEKGMSPLQVMSCDNLSGNGEKLKRAVLTFSREVDAELAAWIEAGVDFPCTMVDSITPATTDDLRDSVFNETGLQDAWPIQRERFTQWVIGTEKSGGEYPDWSSVGAQLSQSVEQFEAAKLKILNGSHSTLALIGSLAGFSSVEEAATNEVLRNLVERMLFSEVIPTLAPLEGMDYTSYAKDILKRYENPAIVHLLSQIAWDSSKKLPIRILQTIQDCLQNNIKPETLCLAIAAWFKFLQDRSSEGVEIIDPLADELVELSSECDGCEQDVDKFIALNTVFPPALVTNAQFVSLLKAAYTAIGQARKEALLTLL